MTKVDDKGEMFVPAEDFLGFPPRSGPKGVNFKKGVPAGPYTAKFVALMREKGLVAGEKPATTLEGKSE